MSTPVRKFTPAEAKAGALLAIKQGCTMAEAAAAVGRTKKWLENLRALDKDYGHEIDVARARRQSAIEGGKDPALYDLSFADWRKRFLKQDTYPHQQMWIDVLEGRPAKKFHPSITYRPRSDRLILVNTPPFHAKSVTITQEYVTYKLCMNPAFRVVIISETAEAAQKFLFSIKQMLTSPEYVELQAAYAPEGGFRPERGDGRWGANQIYLAGRGRDAVDKAAKDPSVQIVGIGGQIYGARADLIILDDCVSDKNVMGYEKQFDWLTRTVMSRAKTGKVLVVGTRIAPVDLYAHLLNDEVYVSGKSPWTYIAQPAVLQFAEKPEDWVTLWPRSSKPMDEAADEHPGEDGLYTCWDGPSLLEVRSSNRPAVWALVYQQQTVGDDMTFQPLCVWGSVDRRRKPGPLTAGAWGHPYNGMEGMRNILAIDPAGTGNAFLLALSADRVKRERWVMNAWMGTNTKPSWYADMIEQIVPAYEIHEIVIETNAYASWLMHDERITRFCRDRGVRLMPHFTQHNKVDPDFGVATMSTLFGSTRRQDDGHGNATGQERHAGDNVIHLPDPDASPGVKALIDQLLTWLPGKRGGVLRQDGPMALWFAELRARAYLLGNDGPPQTHIKNKYLSPRRARHRATIPIGYFAAS